MRKYLIFAIVPILISLFFLSPAVYSQAHYSYNVAGYVFDDRNANGIQDPGEPGVPGKLVYADNTNSQQVYTDASGYFQINNLPAGTHSIEVAGAGSGGAKPTTSEKFNVGGSTNNVRFGIQQGGYDVEGYVVDERGQPVRGALVYVDFPSRQVAYTNNFGYYRIEDVAYDGSTPVYGFSGGHNVYVQGYEANPVLVNPQTPTQAVQANINARTFYPTPGGYTYPSPYTYPTPGTGYTYPTPSYSYPTPGSGYTYPTPGTGYTYPTPSYTYPTPGIGYTYPTPGTGYTYPTPSYTYPTPGASYAYPTPGGQQCTYGAPAGQPFQGCSGSGQWCTMTPTYSSNCQVGNVATNCQYRPGQCGSQTYSESEPTIWGDPENFWQQSSNVSPMPEQFNWTDSSWAQPQTEIWHRFNDPVYDDPQRYMNQFDDFMPQMDSWVTSFTGAEFADWMY